MNPWTVLGWMIVGVFSLFSLAIGFVFLLFIADKLGLEDRLRRGRKYRKSKDIAPAEGQCWTSGSWRIFVIKVDNDGVHIQSESDMWIEPLEKWNRRRHDEGLWLEE